MKYTDRNGDWQIGKLGETKFNETRQIDRHVPDFTVVEAVCGCEDPSVIKQRPPVVKGGGPDSSLQRH